MEILGFVWAASIMGASSATETVAGGQGHGYQSQTPIFNQHMATWLASLSPLPHWRALEGAPMAAFSSYASTTSLLTPTFSQMALLPAHDPLSDDSEFTPLTPIVGAALTNLNPPVATSLPAIAPDSLTHVGQWHSWDAVAAVRLVEPQWQDIAGEAPGNSDCLADSSVTYQASPIAMTASPKVQIWVKNHFIGEVSGRAAAQKLAHKLRALIQSDELDAANLQPIFGRNFVGGSWHSDILFVVDETMRAHPEVPAAAIAVQWVNNLRVALGTEPLDLAQVQMAMDGLAETSHTFYGTASWYGPGFHGRKTANGERFDENALTAAHKTLPFGTYLKVTNRWNSKSVVVRINDRGPYVGNRSLDLSKAAAQCLGSTGKGVVPYEAVVLKSVPQPKLDELTTAQLLPEP